MSYICVIAKCGLTLLQNMPTTTAAQVNDKRPKVIQYKKDKYMLGPLIMNDFRSKLTTFVDEILPSFCKCLSIIHNRYMHVYTYFQYIYSLFAMYLLNRYIKREISFEKES